MAVEPTQMNQASPQSAMGPLVVVEASISRDDSLHSLGLDLKQYALLTTA